MADPQPDGCRGWIRGLVAERLRQPGLATRLLAAAVLSGLDELPLYRAHLLVDHARAARRTGQAEQVQAAHRAPRPHRSIASWRLYLIASAHRRDSRRGPSRRRSVRPLHQP